MLGNMMLWEHLSIWTGLFLLYVAWLLQNALRPTRDYYVLKGEYFHVLDKAPWRKEFQTLYHGFADYHAAKVAFDNHEDYIWSLVLTDLNPQAANLEVIHSLLMVSARSKQRATARLRSEKAVLFPGVPGKDNIELLHQTPGSTLMKNRTVWREFDREQAATTKESPPPGAL